MAHFMIINRRLSPSLCHHDLQLCQPRGFKQLSCVLWQGGCYATALSPSWQCCRPCCQTPPVAAPPLPEATRELPSTDNLLYLERVPFLHVNDATVGKPHG
jgi:hypothetical protein